MNDESDIQKPLDGSYIIDGKVLFNVVLNEITYEGKVFKLAYTESKTLLLLIHHLGEIVARDRIIEYGWSGRVVSDASLAKSISNLRKVLRECTLDDDSILTVPRIGYRFTLSAERSPLTANEYNSPKAYPEISESNNESFTKEVSGSVDVPFDKQELPVNIYGRLNNKASSRLIKGLSKNVNSSVKRAIRLGMYICSLIFIIIAFYQIEDVNSSSLNGEFIAKGYKKSLVTIDNQRYTVISMSGVPLTEDALSIIALSPADTTVFYRSDNGIINLSFLLKNKSISFTYQENNFIKAKCIIREALSGGSRICER